MMKNLSDRTIFLHVRNAGLVTSQFGFSRLCGHRPSWFSVMASMGSTMGIAALGTLAANIALLVEDAGDERRRTELTDLHRLIAGELDRRCRTRALTKACAARASSPAG
jgi:hypothetical protein